MRRLLSVGAAWPAAATGFGAKEPAAMVAMLSRLRPPALLRTDRQGVTSVEYALVAGAMTALLIAGFSALGGDVKTVLAAVAALIPGG